MIVALSGWKGSGKDETAKILVEEFGFVRVAFADVLKDLVAEEYAIPRNYLDDTRYKEAPLLQYPVTPKDPFSNMIAECLIKEFAFSDGTKPTTFTRIGGEFLGVGPDNTEALGTVYWSPRALAILKGSSNRAVDPQFWVSRALKNTSQNIVIADMRYKNEAEQIKSIADKANQKCVTLRIERFDSSPSVDASEHDLDNYVFDFKIENKGNLTEYHSKIRSFMNGLEESL